MPTRPADVAILVTVTTLDNTAQRTAARASRRVARVTAVAGVAGLVAVASLVAAPARAEVPEGWSNPPDVSALDALLLLVGGPLLLLVLIVGAVYVPALARGEKVAPGAGGRVEDQWFGGPRTDNRELPAGAEGDETGGARGSW